MTMPAELMLQRDLFTGELVDTRSPSQRRRDLEADQPLQIEMFSQRELAQYVPRPVMPLSAETRLVLVREDPRTEEEKEHDREVAARALTAPMFEEPEATLTALVSPDTLGADDDADDDESDAAKVSIVEPETRRADAVTELERVVKDITQTIAAEPDVLRAQSMWLALATVEAHTSGAPKEEIVAILHRLDGASPPRVYTQPTVKLAEHNHRQPIVVFEAAQLRTHLPMVAV